jgi:TolA-binding protein
MTKEEQFERLTKLVQAGNYWRVYTYQGTWTEGNCYEHLKLGDVGLYFFTEKEALAYLMSNNCDRYGWNTQTFTSVQERATELEVAIPENFVVVKKSYLLARLEDRINYINEQIAKLELSKQDLLKQKEQI